MFREVRFLLKDGRDDRIESQRIVLTAKTLEVALWLEGSGWNSTEDNITAERRSKPRSVVPAFSRD